jgi:hypothetical protein
MTFPPLPQPSSSVTYEEFLDFLAYMLATSEETSEVNWIIGDVGMGAPQQTPFAYISPRNDRINWSTAKGSTGGLPAPGLAGMDDHLMLVPMTIAVEPHRYLKPVTADPPSSSPVSEANIGQTLPFFEQPGYRTAMQLQGKLSTALRQNITVNGVVATTNIIETTYLLQEIEGKPFRALRIILQAQQRRRRGG